jgi:geranylgeranyl diphosphate synthase type I
MTLDLIPSIESELQRQVARLDRPSTAAFHEMLTYHMGWTGEGAGPEATGKRIRPLLLCLVYLACQPDSSLNAALPAAAAIELVHNFSLVHDDIEDNSPTRRGRQTVWKRWGLPMAVNAGDALFVIAHQAIMDLGSFHEPAIVVQAAKILQDTCLDLTCGQFLDMSFEGRTNVGEADYWGMISGKTSALIAAACSIGAILGEADSFIHEQYANFGHHLGLAFQVQDDILGIWGEEALTGKSSASDLVEGKNSLPILFGIAHSPRFADRWRQGPIRSLDVSAVAQILREDGAYDYAQERAHFWTGQALDSLKAANPRGEAGEVLFGLVSRLIGRQQ